MHDFGQTFTPSPRRVKLKDLTTQEKIIKKTMTLDLTNFVKDEMILINDSFYISDAVGQYLGKVTIRKSWRGGRKNFNAMAAKSKNKTEVTDQKSSNTKANRETSLVCGRRHGREDCKCKCCLHQTLDERGKLVVFEALCYGCLQEIKKEHDARNGSNRKRCKVCSGKHSTILHNCIRKKVNSYA